MTSLLDTQGLRQRASEFPPLVRTYASVLAARGAWARLRGERLAALQSLLRAWRAVGEGFGGAAAAEALVRDACTEAGRLLPAARNGLRLEYLRSPEAAAIRRRFAALPDSERVRLRFPGDADPERQGDLIVLKPFDPATGEKGVLLVKYTEAIRRFAATFDLGALAPRYAVVLEPSSWGYQDLAFLLYLGADLDVVVQAPWKPDHDWIAGLRSNLVPVRLGAGDWVDPAQFAPLGSVERAYDLVMVSSWSPVKRHEELFRTLSVLRRRGRRLRVALVGYPSKWTRAEIERRMRRHGVEDQCTVFEGIPHAEVARVVADSRAYVLLSRREGANKALYEALFCDTPVVVHRRHHGVNADHVTERVGATFEEGTLTDAIVAVLDGRGFEPRRWALEHTGYERSTRALDDVLRGLSLKRGLPWTRGLEPKKNAPNLRYARAGAWRGFQGEYDALRQYLLPAD